MTYVVQPGDNLWSIAARFSVTIQSIITANRLANPHLIAVGQTLYIPTTVPPPPTEGASTGDRIAKMERELDQIVTIIDDYRRQIADLSRRIQRLEDRP